jgi:ferric-dicitrate binding protein FerR (iron transport regulator)
MKKFIAAIFLGGLFFSSNSPAADLKQSKFTQVVNDVQVIASDKSIKPAAVSDLFNMPDVLRTGADSRAELVADDRTITRVGANTVFSFDQANRTVNLQQGSLLFHSDKGKGGGTIRTGAATASVLGTTLIVVSTPNGGFKVLMLEGNGEILFTAGIRQHLAAGQMTFVLPGGKPGPVLYFRLSEQVSHSLLVEGFDQPLSSMSLINAVINIQNRLISSGKVVDTGLLVAGEPNPANPSTVPVVYIPDTPTVSSPPSPTDSGLISPSTSTSTGSSLTGAQLALTQDLGINSSTLNPNNVFIQQPGFNITDPNAFLSPNNPFFGFPANNLNVATPTIDLSPYANQSSLNYPGFDLVAMNNLAVQNSLTFTGLLPADKLFLYAGNQLSIASGSAVEADVADFELGSFAAITLNNVSLLNNTGNVTINSPSGVTLQNSSSIIARGNITIDPVTINAATSLSPGTGTTIISSTAGSVSANNVLMQDNNIGVNAANGISLTGGSLAAVNTVGIVGGTDVSVGGTTIGASDPAGTIGITSTSGSVKVNNNATIMAFNVNVSAGGNITLDTANVVSGSSIVPPVGSQLNLASTGMTTVNNTDLSTFVKDVISADTVVLQNVTFGAGSVVDLHSSLGQLAANPNTSASVVPGDVNFVIGVNYGPTPAQLALVRTAGAAGIFIH